MHLLPLHDRCDVMRFAIYTYCAQVFCEQQFSVFESWAPASQTPEMADIQAVSLGSTWVSSQRREFSGYQVKGYIHSIPLEALEESRVG